MGGGNRGRVTRSVTPDCTPSDPRKLRYVPTEERLGNTSPVFRIQRVQMDVVVLVNPGRLSDWSIDG